MKKTIIYLFIIASAFIGFSLQQSAYCQTSDKPQEVIKKETTVYVTNTGSKYHKSTCGYLKSSSNKIELSKAKEKGYTPCSRCYYASKGLAASRCTAITKAGSQCKRQASEGSNKCWQH